MLKGAMSALKAFGAGTAYGAGNIGRVARGAAFNRGYAFGQFARTPTGMGTLGGAAAGGIWGAASDDTSVLGGMAMGAGLGAVGGRYGFSAARRARLGYRGIGTGMIGGTQGALHVTASPAGMQGALIGAGRGIRNRFMADLFFAKKAIQQV